MIFKFKKMVETDVEIDIKTPAYFKDKYETIYKLSGTGKLTGITMYNDGCVSLLTYADNLRVPTLDQSTEQEFEQVKEKLIKYLETI